MELLQLVTKFLRTFRLNSVSILHKIIVSGEIFRKDINLIPYLKERFFGKSWENIIQFSDIFRGHKSGILVENGLTFR